MSRGKDKLNYIRKCLRRHSDARLAGALGISEAEVQKALSSMGLSRSKADKAWLREHPDEPLPEFSPHAPNCLLYTSDAADDLLCVDLGGRRILKKKKQTIR